MSLSLQGRNQYLLMLMITSFLLIGFKNLWAVDLETSESTEPKDIFDSISDLTDSLRVWSQDTTIFQIGSEDNIVNLDSLELTDLFPDCIVQIDNSSSFVKIALPVYQNLLTTELIYRTTTDHALNWSAPVKWDGQNILVDNIPIPLNGSQPPDSFLMNHISKRIIKLRTLGLPSHLRLEDVYEDPIEINVTIRGPEVEDIPFTLSSWYNTLYKISAGMQVYSGLLKVTIDSINTDLKFYTLITNPGTEGHHFLEWRETYSNSTEQLEPKDFSVMFSPYIRTDNLINLFAKPKNSVTNPIELRINR